MLIVAVDGAQAPLRDPAVHLGGDAGLDLLAEPSALDRHAACYLFVDLSLQLDGVEDITSDGWGELRIRK